MISGIERVCVCVVDMNESLSFYRDIVGLSVVGDQTLDGDVAKTLWDVPDAESVRSVMLKNDIQSLLVELIELKPCKGSYINENGSDTDVGIFDIAFSVKDLTKTHQVLTEKGYSFSTPPMEYSPVFRPELIVRYSICTGPNNMPIPHMQYVSPAPPPMENDYGRIVDSAQFVDDMEASLKFYRDMLGLTVVSDAPFAEGKMDDMLGLPKNTSGRIVMLNKEGSTSPLLELIELSNKGRILSDAARPPNYGIFSIAFKADNLDDLIKVFEKESVQMITEPVSMTLEPYGTIRRLLVRGPSQTLVEFFE